MSRGHHRRQRRVDPKHRGGTIPSESRQLVDILKDYAQIVREEHAALVLLQAQLDAERERYEIACGIIAAHLQRCNNDRARSLVEEQYRQRHEAVAS
jgi:hypothetical protein